MLNKITSFAAYVCTAAALVAGENWLTDFEEAKKQAAEQNKSLLVDFTGSDWCAGCIKLDEEVFQQEAFEKYVTDKFVLVELDFPQTSELSAELSAQNANLAEIYEIQGFPTILLMNSDAKPYAVTGYQEGGVELYIAHLEDLQKVKTSFDASIIAAEKLEGVEKAKGIAAALETLPPKYMNFYQDQLDMVIKLDPEDSTGIKKKIELDKKLEVFSKEVQALMEQQKTLEAAEKMQAFVDGNDLPDELAETFIMQSLYLKVDSKVSASDFEGGITLIDKEIKTKGISNYFKQQLTGMKVDIYMHNNNFDQAKATLEEIVTIDETSDIAQTAISAIPQIEVIKAKQEASNSSAPPVVTPPVEVPTKETSTEDAPTE